MKTALAIMAVSIAAVIVFALHAAAGPQAGVSSYSQCLERQLGNSQVQC